MSCAFSVGSVFTRVMLAGSLFTIHMSFRIVSCVAFNIYHGSCILFDEDEHKCIMSDQTRRLLPVSSMERNWMAPPFCQLSQGPGPEMAFNSLVHNSTPIPLQDDLSSQNEGAYSDHPFSKTTFAGTPGPSTSESMGSIFQGLHNAASYGSQTVCFFHTFYSLRNN